MSPLGTYAYVLIPNVCRHLCLSLTHPEVITSKRVDGCCILWAGRLWRHGTTSCTYSVVTSWTDLRRRSRSVLTFRRRAGRSCRVYLDSPSRVSLPLSSTTYSTSSAEWHRRYPSIQCWVFVSPSDPWAQSARSTRSRPGGRPSTNFRSRGSAVSRSRRWMRRSTSPAVVEVARPATPSTVTIRGPTRWRSLAQLVMKPARWVCVLHYVLCMRTLACRFMALQSIVTYPYCSLSDVNTWSMVLWRHQEKENWPKRTLWFNTVL